MVKLNIQKAIFALEDKVVELGARADAVKADETLSKNTRQTRAYGFRKEMHTLELMCDIIKALGENQVEIELEDAAAKHFDSLTTSSADRVAATTIEVHKGDTLMALLQKYDGRKDILAKIQKACESAGLTLNMATGIVE